MFWVITLSGKGAVLSSLRNLRFASCVITVKDALGYYMLVGSKHVDG